MSFNFPGMIANETPDQISTFRVSVITEPGQTGWTSVICKPMAKGNYSDVAIVLPPNAGVRQLKVSHGNGNILPAVSFLFALINETLGKKEMDKLVRKWATHCNKAEAGAFPWNKHLDPLLGTFFDITGTPTCIGNDRGCQFIDGSKIVDKMVLPKAKIQYLADVCNSITAIDQSQAEQEWNTLMGVTPANRSTPVTSG